MARLHQAGSLQLGDGLAHHRAADAELAHDGGLGGQLVAQGQAAIADAVSQGFDKLQGQCAGLAAKRGIGGHFLVLSLWGAGGRSGTLLFVVRQLMTFNGICCHCTKNLCLCNRHALPSDAYSFPTPVIDRSCRRPGPGIACAPESLLHHLAVV
ncbi:hypothetical protein D3C71_1586330 [compost metagenome]